MKVRGQLELMKNSIRFTNPHKAEGFREGIEMAETICDDVISYREPLALLGEDGCYCGRCRADLLEYITIRIPFCPFCGQAIGYTKERS